MKELNSNIRLETPAVAKLINKMMEQGTTYEDFEKVLAYALSAMAADDAQISMWEAAEKTGIKNICKKYMGNEAITPTKRSGRFTLRQPSTIFTIPTVRQKVLELKPSEIKIGDKICVELKGLGTFMATAHKVTANEILFITDEYIALRPMYGLQEWIETSVYNAFPEELKGRVKNLTIPTVGQVYSWDNEWCRKAFVRDDDEQLPLMKEIRNRVAYLDNNCEWGWLRNSTKREFSSDSFAVVGARSCAHSYHASNSSGVRLEFTLVK
jgi:hypothetical protein